MDGIEDRGDVIKAGVVGKEDHGGEIKTGLEGKYDDEVK